MKTRILTLIVSLFITAMAFAYDAEIDGIYYNLDNENKTAEITYQYSWSADNYSGVTNITIPSIISYDGTAYSVTSIGNGAFYGCSSLTSITIPNSVTSIGGDAFEYCSSLTSITIPNSVTSIGNRAFEYCSSLTSITIPNSVTSIGNKAFEYCSSLTSITIPNSVTSIGNYAFYKCSSLTSITIKATTPPTLGTNAFGQYLAIYIPDNRLSAYKSAWGTDYVYVNNETSLTINVKTPGTLSDLIFDAGQRPAFVVKLKVTGTLNDDDFTCMRETMTSLVDIDLSEITNTTGVNFGGKNNLVKIILPNNLTSISYRAFLECSSLTSISIPNSVTSIGNYAFYLCYSLTSITIPNSVTSIGDEAFKNCLFLTSITIPNSVTSIGYGAFYNCSSLTSITIPNSLTSIGGGAFEYCSSLTSITIPNSITSIGGNAFRGCSSLTSITMKPKIAPSLGNTPFPDNISTCYIYFPCVYYDSYSHYYNILSHINVKITPKNPNLDLFIARKDSIIISKQEYKYTFNEQKFTKNETVNLQGINWTLKTDAEYFGFDGNNTNSLERGQQIGSAKKPASYITLKTENIADKITKIKVNTSGANSINATFSISVNGIKYLPTSVNLTNAATEYEFSGAESGEITLNWTNNSSKAIYIKSIQITSEKSECFIENNETSQQGIINILQKNDCENNIAKIEAVGHWGYKFKQWNDGNTENPREIVVEDDTTIIAEFEPCAIYNVQLNCDEKLGSVFGAGKYNETTKTEISALAKEGYHFVKWSDGNTENPRTITVTEDINLTAEFAIDQYQVTLESNGNGSVTGSGTYDYGTEITIEATANENYHFVRWSDGNTENPRIIIVTEDMNLTAEFAIDQYQVTLESNGNGSVTGSGTYDYGTEITIEAIADKGYHFEKWSDGNIENPRTITVTENITLSAEFAIDQYQVTLESNGNGSVTGSGTYDYGTEITIEATANENYHFVRWSDGNTENPRTIVVTEEVELMAEFEEDDKTMDDNVDESSVIVYVQDGVIYIEGADADYNVFDASGRLIYTGRDAQLSLPRGVYVIAVGGEVEKVVI